MSSLPQKGSIIINPKTQRPVRVGSRTWLKLVKQGVLAGNYSDQKELEKPQSVRQEKRSVRFKPTEMSRYTAQVASRVVSNNIDTLVDADDLNETLEQLILSELAGEHGANGPVDSDYGEEEKTLPIKVKRQTRRPKGLSKKQQQHAQEYWATQEPEEVEYSEDEYYSE